MDLAASIQAVTEEVVLRLTRALAVDTGADNLCLAGGVALIAWPTARCLRDGKFSASGSSRRGRCRRRARGGARAYHIYKGHPRKVDNKLDYMDGSFLGPSFADDDSAGG